jgi:hypothetical protein
VSDSGGTGWGEPPAGPPSGPESSAPPPIPPPPSAAPPPPPGSVPPPVAYSGTTGVPLREMGAGEIIDSAFKLYRANWKALMGIVALIVVPVNLLEQILLVGTVHQVRINGQTLFFSAADQHAFVTITLLFAALQLLVVAPLLAGAMARATAELYMGRRPGIADTMNYAIGRLGSLLLVTILFSLSVAGGFLLLIIPGIIFWVRLNFSTIAVVVEDARGRKALGRSWNLTRNHSWRIFGTLLLAGLIAAVTNAILLAPFNVLGWTGLSGGFARLISESIANILTQPFTALVATLLYFDLRIRKEGLDLAIMARDLGTSPSVT